MNLIKPVSKNSVGKFSFYILEIMSVVFFVVYFILAIINGTEWKSFSTFVSQFFSGTFDAVLIYAIGRIIDLLSANKLDKDETKE